MLNLITLSWAGYFIVTGLFLYACWRIFSFLPLTYRLGILFSQMAILFIPAKVDASSAQAPLFIVLAINSISSVPANEILVKTLPLIFGLIFAWFLAILVQKLKTAKTNPTN